MRTPRRRMKEVEPGKELPMPTDKKLTRAENQPIHSGDAENQYLTFLLADEEYGVEILRVQEIKSWEDTTPIPNTPAHVMGVINIRGEIVPIIDLRLRFEIEQMSRSPTTVIVVVKMRSEDQERTIGLVVDAVSEVYRFDEEHIQPTPELGGGISADCIRGLATVENKMVLLVDTDKLIDFSSIGQSPDTDAVVST
jgi:purine-binding chemotaxis protein CheW